MKRHRLSLALPIILSLLLTSTLSYILKGQSKGQAKEPPIPVIIGSGQSRIQIPNVQSIVLTVSDFNFLMQREDSLRKTIAEQTHQLRYESRSKSFLLYALIVGLFLSNIASVRIVSRRMSSTKK